MTASSGARRAAHKGRSLGSGGPAMVFAPKTGGVQGREPFAGAMVCQPVDQDGRAPGASRTGSQPAPTACAWCDQPFEPLKRGDQRKVFCSTPCRMAFHKTARRWAEAQFTQGRVTVAEQFLAVYGAGNRL